MTDNTGKVTGKDFNIILSNNSPKEYAEIFSRNENDPTLKSILSFDVIAFKNCYPTTKITSEQQPQTDLKYYQSIRDALKKYPRKKFILLTPPPVRKNTTTKENAKRAVRLAKWLCSDEYLQDTTNISVFDFFHLLADVNGFLKKEYQRMLHWDSHPNKKANRTVAPLFSRFLGAQASSTSQAQP